MPNPHPVKPLSNRDKGTDRHLAEKSIDPWMFKLLVRAKAPVSTIRFIVKELYGKDYREATISGWRKQLRDEWEAEKAVKQ